MIGAQDQTDTTHELTVHQDTTINASRTVIGVSIAGLVAFGIAMMSVGGYVSRLERVERDMSDRATVTEVEQLRTDMRGLKLGQDGITIELRGLRDLIIERMAKR